MSEHLWQLDTNEKQEWPAIEQLITQEELAFRWKISEATLERDRSLKKGVRYMKIGGLIRYRLEDIINYENACMREPEKNA